MNLIPSILHKIQPLKVRSSSALSKLKKVIVPISIFKDRVVQIYANIKSFFGGFGKELRRKPEEVNTNPFMPGKSSAISVTNSTLSSSFKPSLSGDNDTPIMSSVKGDNKLSEEENCREWALNTNVNNKLCIQGELLKADKKQFKKLCLLRMKYLKTHMDGSLPSRLVRATGNLFFRDSNKDEFKELTQELTDFDNDPDRFVRHLESFEDSLGIFPLRKILDIHHLKIDTSLSLFDIKENSLNRLEHINDALSMKKGLIEKIQASNTKKIVISLIKPFNKLSNKIYGKRKKDRELLQRQITEHQNIIDSVNEKMEHLKKTAKSYSIPLVGFLNLSKDGVCGLLYEHYPESALALFDVWLTLLEKDIGANASTSRMFFPFAGGQRKKEAIKKIEMLKKHLKYVDINTPNSFSDFLSELAKYEKEFEKVPLSVALDSKFSDLPGAEKIKILEVKSSGGVFNWLVNEQQHENKQYANEIEDAETFILNQEKHHQRLSNTPLLSIGKQFTTEHVCQLIKKNPKYIHDLLSQVMSSRISELLSKKETAPEIPYPTEISLKEFLMNPENDWVMRDIQSQLASSHIIKELVSLEPNVLCDILISDCSRQLVKNHDQTASRQLGEITKIKSNLNNKDSISEGDLSLLFSTTITKTKPDFSEIGVQLQNKDSIKNELTAFTVNSENSDLIYNTRLQVITIYLKELNDYIISIDAQTADIDMLSKASKARQLFNRLKESVNDDPTVELCSKNIEDKYLEIRAAQSWLFIMKQQSVKNKSKIYLLPLPDRKYFIEKACQLSVFPSTEVKLFRKITEHVEHLPDYYSDPDTITENIHSIKRDYYELFSLQQEKIYKDTLLSLEQKDSVSKDAFLGVGDAGITANSSYLENITLLKNIDKQRRILAWEKPSDGILSNPLSYTTDLLSGAASLKDMLGDLEHKRLLIHMGYDYKKELAHNLTCRLIPDCLRFWDKSQTTTNQLSQNNESQTNEQIEKQGEASVSILNKVLSSLADVQSIASCHPKFRAMLGNSVALAVMSMGLAGITLSHSQQILLQATVHKLSLSYTANSKQLTLEEFDGLSKKEKQLFKDIQFLNDSCSMMMMPLLATTAVKDALCGDFSFSGFTAGITTFGYKSLFESMPDNTIHAMYNSLAVLSPYLVFSTDLISGAVQDISGILKGEKSIQISAGKALFLKFVTPLSTRYKAITFHWANRHENGWKPFFFEVAKISIVIFSSLMVVGLGSALTAITYSSIIPIFLAVPEVITLMYSLFKMLESADTYGGLLGSAYMAYSQLFASDVTNKKAIRDTCRANAKSLMEGVIESPYFKDAENHALLRSYYNKYLTTYYEQQKEMLGNSESVFRYWLQEQNKSVDTWLRSQRKDIVKQAKVISKNLKIRAFIDEQIMTFSEESLCPVNITNINKTFKKLGANIIVNKQNFLQSLMFYKNELQSCITPFFDHSIPGNEKDIILHLEQQLKEMYVGSLIKESSASDGSYNRFEEESRKYFHDKVEKNLSKEIERRLKENIVQAAIKTLPVIGEQEISDDKKKDLLKKNAEELALQSSNIAEERLSKPQELFKSYVSMMTDDVDQDDIFYDALDK